MQWSPLLISFCLRNQLKEPFPKTRHILGVPDLPAQPGWQHDGLRIFMMGCLGLQPRWSPWGWLPASSADAQKGNFGDLKNICSVCWSSFVLLQKCIYLCYGTRAGVVYGSCVLFDWFYGLIQLSVNKKRQGKKPQTKQTLLSKHLTIPGLCVGVFFPLCAFSMLSWGRCWWQILLPCLPKLLGKISHCSIWNITGNILNCYNNISGVNFLFQKSFPSP